MDGVITIATVIGVRVAVEPFCWVSPDRDGLSPDIKIFETDEESGIMEFNHDQTMTATVPAVDHDNAPIIEVGDELTIRTSKNPEKLKLRTGDWVIVRNSEIRHGLYAVRQYWPVEDGVLLVAGNPSIPAHRVTRQDVIDGIVLEIRKVRPRQLVEN